MDKKVPNGSGSVGGLEGGREGGREELELGGGGEGLIGRVRERAFKEEPQGGGEGEAEAEGEEEPEGGMNLA